MTQHQQGQAIPRLEPGPEQILEHGQTLEQGQLEPGQGLREQGPGQHQHGLGLGQGPGQHQQELGLGPPGLGQHQLGLGQHQLGLGQPGLGLERGQEQDPPDATANNHARPKTAK